MCGICGLARPAAGASPVPEDLVVRMCRTIVHRGPDDEGVYVDERVGLGNRRLSIIDLVTGHQPLSNEDGSVWIAYNGEAYNFAEIRDDLIARGHAMATKSDTETLVHAYEEWGAPAFLDRFRGMFAFALWDKRIGKLFLFRDRLGVKPLYYTLTPGGTLVFGSELKTILTHPSVERELEPRALDLFLTLEYVPAPFSIFKGIYKLPAGHFLEYEAGKITIRKYWDIEPEAGPPRQIKPAELPGICDELYALLKESVKLRLVSDVPLGAFLSGGIDSSTIVALMRELGASPLKTFSIGFADQTYNELHHARRIAELFETEHEEFIIEPQALELTETLIRHLDEPLGDFSIFPTYLVSKMTRAHATVALSGDGGDELFAGYEHYQAQRMARRFAVPAGGKAVGALVGRLRPSDKKKGTWNKLRRFTEGFDHETRLRHLRWMMFMSARDRRSLYAPGFVELLGGIKGVDDGEPFAGLFEKASRFDDITGELYLDLKSYLVDDIMVKVDRMSMAVSLEAREPLLDHKLVEFAFRLPGDLKLRGGQTKWILKKTMERVLPAENVWRGKEGFSIPIKHWLKTDLRDLMEDVLAEDRIVKDGLFNPKPVRAMIDAHLAGRENYSHQLWALMVFQMWKSTYLG
jgi:asparagine synthase (glutamine-hydrolysing)